VIFAVRAAGFSTSKPNWKQEARWRRSSDFSCFVAETRRNTHGYLTKPLTSARCRVKPLKSASSIVMRTSVSLPKIRNDKNVN
jgi:hypothetical protein